MLEKIEIWDGEDELWYPQESFGVEGSDKSLTAILQRLENKKIRITIEIIEDKKIPAVA